MQSFYVKRVLSLHVFAKRNFNESLYVFTQNIFSLCHFVFGALDKSSYSLRELLGALEPSLTFVALNRK